MAAATATSVVALCLLSAGTASAHDQLISSSPKAGQSVGSPMSEIALTFDQELLDVTGTGSAFAIQVMGPDKRYYESGCASLKGQTVTASTELGKAGSYKVVWQILSKDGHVTSDTYRFSYAPPAGVEVARGFSNALTCNSGVEERSSKPSASSKSVSEAGVSWSIVGVVGGALVVVIIALVVFLLVKSRRLNKS